MNAFKLDLLTALAIIVTLGVVVTMSFDNAFNNGSMDTEKASKIQAKVFQYSRDRFEFVKAQSQKANKVPGDDATL